MADKPVLIDVDGVLADFEGKCIQIIKYDFGLDIPDRNIGHEDVREMAGKDRPKLEKIIKSSGFAQDLDPIPGGKEAVNKLLFNGEDVFFLTAPYTRSQTWGYDRTKWLEDYLGAHRKDVIFAKNKAPVDGKCLIDDKPENIKDWIEYPHRQEPYFAILFAQPWNEDFEHELLGDKILRTNDWDTILDVIIGK